eukprot:6387324-Prymnesium_polylepis.1
MHKCEPYARDQILRPQNDFLWFGHCRPPRFVTAVAPNRKQAAMGDHGGPPPSSGTKRFFYDSMTS